MSFRQRFAQLSGMVDPNQLYPMVSVARGAQAWYGQNADGTPDWSYVDDHADFISLQHAIAQGNWDGIPPPNNPAHYDMTKPPGMPPNVIWASVADVPADGGFVAPILPPGAKGGQEWDPWKNTTTWQGQVPPAITPEPVPPAPTIFEPAQPHGFVPSGGTDTPPAATPSNVIPFPSPTSQPIITPGVAPAGPNDGPGLYVSPSDTQGIAPFPNSPGGPQVAADMLSSIPSWVWIAAAALVVAKLVRH